MKSFFLYALMAGIVMFTACNDDDDDPPVEEEGDKYTELTVEQNKEKLEDTGLAMMDEMKEMEEEPALEVNNSLMHFIGVHDPFDGGEGDESKLHGSLAFKANHALQNIHNTGLNGVFKSITVTPAEEDGPESIQEIYDMLVGVYSWNATLEEWDYLETGDVILFQFPSTEDGTTNDASYTVSYVGYDGVNPIEDYEGDLPQDVDAVLAVDGVTVMSLAFDFTYDNEGFPTSIEAVFAIGAFKFEASISNADNEEFATSYTFSHAEAVLVKVSLEANGDWNMDNIEENTHYYYEYYDTVNYEWVQVEVTSEDDYDWEEVDIHKVINDGNALFQVMNIKIVGAVDISSLGTAMEAIDDQYDWEQDSLATIDEVEAINEHVSLSLRFVDTDEIIALVEAYPIRKAYTYETHWYNDQWNETAIEVTEYEHEIDFRFVFADGSPINQDVFFNEGFEDLIVDFEDFMEELGDTYGWDDDEE